MPINDELSQIEECLVAPGERRPGRTYERVQETLLEIRALRGVLARALEWVEHEADMERGADELAREIREVLGDA